MNTSVSTLHKYQTFAILLMVLAGGCDVGQFALSMYNTWGIGITINVLLHFLPTFIIMAFAIQFFYAPQRLAPRIWVSVLSMLSVIGTVVLIILGAVNPDPNSVGVHSPGDWTVAIAIFVGALLWFATLLVERAQSVRAKREAIA